MEELAEKPVDVSHLTKKGKMQQKRKKKLLLTTMVRKYQNFDIATYSKVHRIRLSEKLIKTLERNDVERPKVLQKKTLVLNDLNDSIETLA